MVLGKAIGPYKLNDANLVMEVGLKISILDSDAYIELYSRYLIYSPTPSPCNVRHILGKMSKKFTKVFRRVEYH